MTFEEKHAFVTGGAGFIGSHLCQKILDEGGRVTAYDNLSTGKHDYIANLIHTREKMRFIEGDVRDSKTLKKSSKECDIIFHLAAQTSVPLSMKNPKEECNINVGGAVNVLEAARKSDAKLIFASSAAVYGNPSKRPTPEEYPPHPVSLYGLSKYFGEEYCKFYKETYNIEFAALRIFNAYGPNGHGVIPDFIEKLKKSPHYLEVLGTGKQARDFIHISDLVSLFLSAAKSSKSTLTGQIYNAGSGNTINVTDVAKMIIKFMKLKNVRISFKGGEAWQGDLDITQADNSKVIKELNWKPQIRFEKGLEDLVIQTVF